MSVTDSRGPRPAAAPRATEQSTAELIQRASDQVSRLIRDELALARAELVDKGKHAGIGAGLFGGGGVLAIYGVGALIATVILLLAEAMPAWLAALIVTVVLLLAAGVLALVGRREVQRAAPPAPEEAVAGVKADVDVVADAVRRGRSANGNPEE